MNALKGYPSLHQTSSTSYVAQFQGWEEKRLAFAIGAHAQEKSPPIHSVQYKVDVDAKQDKIAAADHKLRSAQKTP
jgi:hypothetical protein